MITKAPITIMVDKSIKQKAMWIIQNKLCTSVSSYINDRFKELVLSHDKQTTYNKSSTKLTKEVKHGKNN